MCYGTDFNSACIDNENLLSHIQQNKAINVPEMINYKLSDLETTFPLQIISRCPEADTTEAPILATFNKLLNNSTIDSSTVKLIKATDGSDVEGTVSLQSSDNKTIVFVPSYTLEPDTSYTVTISGAIKDLSDKALHSDISWSFSTIKTSALENSPIFGVTASSNDGNIPLNVMDNNLNTRWSNLGIGSWIRLDLGVQKVICSVDIAWYKGNERQSNIGKV